MPIRFTNIASSGRVRFLNISNSGRVYFAPSTTTTSTTTTTTTGPQVWYTLERCYDLVTFYSTNYNTGTFSINDIVSYGGGPSVVYFRVTAVNSSNPGGTQFSISATGLGSCPTTTTTTTTTTLAPVTFTATPSCVSSTQAQIVVNNFAGGTGTYSWIASGSSQANAFTNLNGGGTRYAITGPSYTFTNLAVNTTFYIAVKDSGGNNSTAVAVTTPSCTTTTTSTTTTTTTTLYSVNVYASIQGNNSPGSARVYYRINGGSWTLLGTRTNPPSTACTDSLIGTVNGVPSGATFEVGLTNTSDGNITFAAGNGTQCSATNFLLCGRTTTYSQSITSATNIYATAQYSAGLVTC